MVKLNTTLAVEERKRQGGNSTVREIVLKVGDTKLATLAELTEGGAPVFEEWMAEVLGRIETLEAENAELRQRPEVATISGDGTGSALPPVQASADSLAALVD